MNMRNVGRPGVRNITPSGYLKRVVEQWDPSGAYVVYNTVDAAPVVETREALRQWFHCADRQVILTNARAVPWKGVDFLLEVVKDLPSDRLFVVIGEGPMRPAWEAQAHSLGIMDRVRFLGRLSHHEVMQWAKAADRFVLASGYEGFPHVVVEAVIMGLPTLVSDRGGNPEIARLFRTWCVCCRIVMRRRKTHYFRRLRAFERLRVRFQRS